MVSDDIQRSIDELVEDIARFYGVTPDAVRAMLRRTVADLERDAIEGVSEEESRGLLESARADYGGPENAHKALRFDD